MTAESDNYNFYLVSLLRMRIKMLFRMLTVKWSISIFERLRLSLYNRRNVLHNFCSKTSSRGIYSLRREHDVLSDQLEYDTFIFPLPWMLFKVSLFSETF